MEKILAGINKTTTREPIYFKLPIEHSNGNTEVSQNIIDDMELLTGETPIYKTVFNIDDDFKSIIIDKLAKNYTTDKKFIKDSQIILSGELPNIPNYDDIMKIRSDIENETSFIEKYNFIDWKNLDFLNNNSQFLQALSLYEISSPVLSLALPILLLIIPFFIIKIQGYDMDISTYFNVLKTVLSKHSIGQIFSLKDAGWDKRIYAIISLVFYSLQVYYNIQSCRKFISNFKIIHERLFSVRDYLRETLISIEDFRHRISGLNSYIDFDNELCKASEYISDVVRVYNQITPCSITLRKSGEIGLTMKCFYQLYKVRWVTSTLEYAINYNSYIYAFRTISSRLKCKQMNKCKIGSKTKFSKAYYPALVDIGHVDNTIDIRKNILITGPNAAGKTTLLKTTLINVILSQQFGCGFYKKATIKPYTHIHCYINIPDTSGRDSLFQAEARRCKDIIDSVSVLEKSNHFCVFDEIFSGTNPYEAVSAATAFLEHLNNLPNVSYMITTHFLGVCKSLSCDDKVKNVCMDVHSSGTNFTYTYKIKSGISDVRGGLKVLIDLKYPESIISSATKKLDEIVF
tara:strand:- start:381 stop:2099 length:1719 start_codon:yes stop_codon:yes gene_type:complete